MQEIQRGLESRPYPGEAEKKDREPENSTCSNSECFSSTTSSFCRVLSKYAAVQTHTGLFPDPARAPPCS